MFSRFRQSRARRTGPREWQGPAGARAYAIGDVHGRLDLLELMMERIQRDRRESPRARDYLILLGDLIDRGPDSRGVIDYLIHLPDDGVRPVFLMGNHEEMMLRVLGDEAEALNQWLTYGGYEFAQSYEVEVGRLAAMAPADAAALIRSAVPRSHFAFIEGFADSFTFGDYLFVHAGMRPGKSLEEQDTHDLRWIRDEFLNDDSDHGCMVVHGHTISAEPEERENRIGIDTGAYHSGVLTALRIEGSKRRMIQVDERDL